MIRAYEFIDRRGQIDKTKILKATKYYLSMATSNCKVIALVYIDRIELDNVCNVCGHQLMCKRQLYNKVV